MKPRTPADVASCFLVLALGAGCGSGKKPDDDAARRAASAEAATRASASASAPASAAAPPPAARPAADGAFASLFVTSLALAKDGTEAYLTQVDFQKLAAHVVVAKAREGKWGSAEPVPFSGEGFRDVDPAASPDDRRLFFASTRPLPGRTSDPSRDLEDLWYVERTAAGWGPPQHLSGPSSASAKESSPSVTRDGTLYFASVERATPNAIAIYRSKPTKGVYGRPEKLGPEVNAGPSDAGPFVSPDGKSLWFHSSRQGGAGQTDLYVSCAQGEGWGPAHSLGPAVNTPLPESKPHLSPDGRTLFFVRGGKAFQIALEALPRPCGDPG
jgi:hypothetical protein